MATDQSFYEWARRAPGALARLAGVEGGAGYTWQSIVLKRVEHRLDGVLSPLEEGAPLVFVEFQGYPDERFLMRWLLGIVLHLEQSATQAPVKALVLYVKASHARAAALELGSGQERLLEFRPRSVVLGDLSPEHLLQAGLPELVPLLPLTAVPAEALPREAPGWARLVLDSALQEPLKLDLIGLLGAFLKHRLPALGFEALQRLLGGITVEDTPLGQMLIEKGIEQGIEQGRQEGIEQGIESGRQQEVRLALQILEQKLGRPTTEQERQRVDRLAAEPLQQFILELALTAGAAQAHACLERLAPSTAGPAASP